MHLPSRAELATQIFNVTAQNFGLLAQQVFHYQIQHNPIYKSFITQRFGASFSCSKLEDFPFLPISFFKTHAVKSFDETPEIIFTSSGTTANQTSRHYVKSIALYEESFNRGFNYFYGNANQYAFLCLLPGYMEREGSSLIYMAHSLVKQSPHPQSGFFLRADEALLAAIEACRQQQTPAILLGVTFALLDFAEQYAGLSMQHLHVMETGGMKGRRVEMVRADMHHQLKQAFHLPQVHSEYGMTELLSQAYAKADGRYWPPPWMKVWVRSEDDPLEIKAEGRGMLCIIDLANLDSCSFIETADVGNVFADGSFEVLGRIDHSDIRGCSLLAI